MQNARPSGSKNEPSIGVHASNIESSESKNEDISLKASDMKEIRQPAKSLYQNELNLEDGIKASKEEYHMVRGVGRQLHRQISQNSQYSDNTTCSHTSQNTSTSMEKQLDPNNQIEIAIKKLANKKSQSLPFHPKTTTLPQSSDQKMVGSPVDQPTELNTKYVDEITQQTHNNLVTSETKKNKRKQQKKKRKKNRKKQIHPIARRTHEKT